MLTSEPKELTDLARIFLEPANSTQRQYEALRAFFVDHLPSADAARRFGYTPGSFRVLVHQFRQDPHPTPLSILRCSSTIQILSRDPPLLFRGCKDNRWACPWLLL